jgi:hypothetical protein
MGTVKNICYLSLLLKLQKSCDTRLVSVKIAKLCYWQVITGFKEVNFLPIISIYHRLKNSWFLIYYFKL